MSYLEENRDMVQWVEAEIRANGLSQAAVGRAIGYASGTISQFFSGKYQGDAQNILNRLVQFIRALQTSKDVVETESYKAATEFLGIVRSGRKLGVLLGDSGVGKTKIMRTYAVHNERIAYVEVVQAMNSREVLYSVADALLSSSPGGTVYECQVAIQKTLRQRPAMIIIDQADLLSIKAMDILRSIHDDGNCSMVFVGLPYLEMLMKRGPRSRENLVYLYSRVGLLRILPRAMKSDVQAFCKKYEFSISDFFANDVVTWVRNAGEFRMLKNIFDEAKNLVGKIGSSDEEAITAAKKVVMRKAA